MKKGILGVLLFFSTLTIAQSTPSFYGKEKSVKIGDTTISYYRFGQGKPLVLVTGHGDTMMDWHPDMLRLLQKDREVIIFDYPGIGKSTTTSTYPDTMADLSNIVHQFIKSQKLNKPDVLGFSMGGSVTLKLATLYGNEYDHIIAVGGKAGGPETVAPQQKYFKLLSDPSIPPETAVKKLLFPPSAVKEANAYLQTMKSLPSEKMDPKALKAQAHAVTKENKGKGIWKSLPKIKNNILIINGTEDVLTPVINAQRIADAIPGSWLVRIKGAGHGVLFQKPIFGAKLIQLFLEQDNNQGTSRKSS